MEKIFRLAAPLIFAASFVAPLLAAAQFDYACSTPCPAGTYCNSNGQCVSTSQTVTQAPSGAINQAWLIYYRDTIVWTVNFVLVPILMAVAFIVFLWGVYKYFILGADSEEDRKTGRKYVLWGVIAFVIITSVWGLVNIVKDTLIPSTAGSSHPAYPTL